MFLPALEEGTMPIRQALDDEAALEEERRLLYVGITRARLDLVLSWAERRDTAAARAGAARAASCCRSAAAGPPGPGEAAAGAARPGSPAAPRRLGRAAVAALREWRTAARGATRCRRT